MHFILRSAVNHLEGFISPRERSYLLQLGEHRYNRSRVIENQKRGIYTTRTSSTAYLPKEDAVVQRIVFRASSLQGYVPCENQEALHLTRYTAGQQSEAYWDDYQDEEIQKNNSQRSTTIFAVLEATCEECGTRFSSMSIDWSKEDSRWCQFVECNDTTGATIKPIPGNALFWKNLDISGHGDWRTLHAGLPPLMCKKNWA